MNEYKHGSYANEKNSSDLATPSGVGTLPVYFGVLPIHQLEDFTGKVNTAVMISSANDALAKVGYNDLNWKNYDLCEAIYAHFKTDLGAIGPIVVVNALDPSTMKDVNKTSSVALVNGVGEILKDTVILKTVSIAGKTKGTDFIASYATDGSKVIIKDLKGTIVSPVTVTYDEVKLSDLDETDIVACMSALDTVYQDFNMVPTILDSPGWSHFKVVNDEMKRRAALINGHFRAYVHSNIEANSTTNTYEKAITFKGTKLYNSERETPCWPMGKAGDKIFHLSTLSTVSAQKLDFNNDNVPYETVSNKQISISGLCLADGTDVKFDMTVANALNASGIRTGVFWQGVWKLWGGHTGAFVNGAEIAPDNVFDCSRRMMDFLMNLFQLSYGGEVDKPFARSRKDTILNDYQAKLDNYASRGALLYGKILFNAVSNPASDMIQGDFVYDIATTTTPPGKSITGNFVYTKTGLSALTGGTK